MKRYALAALIGAGLSAGAAHAGVTVTYENPGVENTTATLGGPHGVETFNSLNPGVQSFSTDYGTGHVITGDYSDVVIRSPDIYGGAGGSNFAGADFTHTITLDLTNTADAGGVKYFGFWLSALDAGNLVTLSENGSQFFSFDPSKVLAAVGSNPAYFGNPDQGHQDAGEPFVFVNFFSTTAFNQITFSESINGNGYESDNHTVAGAFREVTGNPLPGVPEPETWALMIMGFGGAGALLRRQRRRAALA
jgi:hypothetical protein